MELLPVSMLGSCLFLHSQVPHVGPRVYHREILVLLGLFFMELFTVHVNKILVENRICFRAVGHSYPLLFFMLLFSKSVSREVRSISILNGFFTI